MKKEYKINEILKKDGIPLKELIKEYIVSSLKNEIEDMNN